MLASQQLQDLMDLFEQQLHQASDQIIPDQISGEIQRTARRLCRALISLSWELSGGLGSNCQPPSPTASHSTPAGRGSYGSYRYGVGSCGSAAEPLAALLRLHQLVPGVLAEHAQDLALLAQGLLGEVGLCACVRV